MIHSLPTVADYMTILPQAIAYDEPLSAAGALMTELQIRHLPVLRRGEIVGIISERDVALLEALAAIDPAKLTVAEAMTPDPYIVDSTAPLEEVAATMSRRKIGAAIISAGGQLEGVLTTIDGLRALSDLLRRNRTGSE